MPIIDEEKWMSWVNANTDHYGNACIVVAKKAMKILDEEIGDFDPHKLICRADREALGDNYGITGFMAGAVASMISQCHSRGEEFRKKWNLAQQLQNEGEKANRGTGVLNPALINIG